MREYFGYKSDMEDWLSYLDRLLPTAENTTYDPAPTIKTPTQTFFGLVTRSSSPTSQKELLRRRLPTIELITFWQLQLFKANNLFQFVYSSSSGQSSTFQGHFSESSIAFLFSTLLIHLTVTLTVSAGKLVKITTCNKKIPDISSNAFRKWISRLPLNVHWEFILGCNKKLRRAWKLCN